MVLTVTTLAQWAGVTLDGSDGTGGLLSAVELANQAGNHLTNAHMWKWQQHRWVSLALRGQVDVTAGLTDTSGQVLTQSGAFAGYDFVPGDKFQVTEAGAGTGVKLGDVQIAGKISDDQIALVENINNTPDIGTTGIVGKIVGETIKLPRDFRAGTPHTAIADSDAVINGVQFVTIDLLLRMRTNTVDVTSYGNYYGAVVYGTTPNVVVGNVEYYDPPQPVLEIHPSIPGGDEQAFTMYYRSGWCPVETDNDVIRIPDWMEPCFIQLYQAMVHGYLEADEKPMAVHLAEWETSPVLRAAKARDGSVQPSYGKMRGGAAQQFSNVHQSVPSRFTTSDPF